MVSFLPLVEAWAVPVLPATSTPFNRARPPVPPSWFAIFVQRNRAVLIQNFTNETWIVRNPAVRDSGVGHRHLQRRRQHITLPDRNVGGVSLRPAFPRIMDRHPLRPGHDPRLLAREVDASLLTQAERVASLINRVDSSRVSKLIEKRIA